jgi:hypothetical protein
MAQDLQPWWPSTTSLSASGYDRSVAMVRYSTSRLRALENARKLIGYFANARPADAEGYINGLAEIFEQYPLGIVEECCSITRGVARSCGDFLPSPQRVMDWCNRQLGAAQNLIRIGPPEPERQFTEEERVVGRRAITKLLGWMKAGWKGDPPTWQDAISDTKLLPPPEVDVGGLFQKMPADTQHQVAAE